MFPYRVTYRTNENKNKTNTPSVRLREAVVVAAAGAAAVASVGVSGVASSRGTDSVVRALAIGGWIGRLDLFPKRRRSVMSWTERATMTVGTARGGREKTRRKSENAVAEHATLERFVDHRRSTGTGGLHVTADRHRRRTTSPGCQRDGLPLSARPRSALTVVREWFTTDRYRVRGCTTGHIRQVWKGC